MEYAPNHGKRWQPDEDEEIKSLFKNGVPTNSIAAELGRKEGGVISRLEMLGLIESHTLRPPAVITSAPPQRAAHEGELQTSHGLRDYLKVIYEVVRRGVPQSWVKTEINQMTARGGHIYLELVEHDDKGQVIAKVRGMIWKDKATALQKKFKDGTGSPLGADMKVLLHVRAEMHPQYGLSLVILDIDPAYTLGDMEAKLASIRLNLKQRGLYDLNRQYPQPTEFTRVAVISPQDAAGLGDFKREATILADLNLCAFTYLHATFQGSDAPGTVLHALRQALEMHQAGRFDALVLIRGGGAKADLQWLNDGALAEAVCRMPLPVFTGIGHERDSTILDEVATSFDTPSKVIRHIAETITRNATQARQDIETIQQMARADIEAQRQRVRAHEQSIQQSGRAAITRAEDGIKQMRGDLERSRDMVRQAELERANAFQGVRDNVGRIVSTQTRDVDTHRIEISERSRHRLEDGRRSVSDNILTLHDMGNRNLIEARRNLQLHDNDLARESLRMVKTTHERVEVLEQGVKAHHPMLALARGYAIVRGVDGRIVTSRAQGTHEETLILTMRDGTITTTNKDYLP